LHDEWVDLHKLRVVHSPYRSTLEINYSLTIIIIPPGVFMVHAILDHRRALASGHWSALDLKYLDSSIASSMALGPPPFGYKSVDRRSMTKLCPSHVFVETLSTDVEF